MNLILETFARLWRNSGMPSKEELQEIMRPPPQPEITKRHHYKEAFIMSPKLLCRIVQVSTISDGIAILEALGEGKLMVSTRKRDKKKGFFAMAECDLTELSGKSEQEIFDLLDERMDAILKERS